MPFYAIGKTKKTVKTEEIKVLNKTTCDFCKRDSTHTCLYATHFINDNLISHDNLILCKPILKFCDFICARLYDVNIHKLSIDYASYLNAYNKKELSERAESVFKLCEGKLLDQIVVKYLTPEELKIYYSPNESVRHITIAKIKGAISARLNKTHVN